MARRFQGPGSAGHAAFQIVLTKVEEHQEGKLYAGRPWGPQRTVQTVRAVVWLRKATDFAIPAARAWADAHGWQVHQVALGDRDPLGTAKQAALKLLQPNEK